jgi:hypothetical protein
MNGKILFKEIGVVASLTTAIQKCLLDLSPMSGPQVSTVGDGTERIGRDRDCSQ